MAFLSPRPCLLILNGASSSGKTTLLKALQDIYPGPLLDCGLDKFLWMLPGRYLNPSLWKQVFRYEGHDPHQGKIERIEVGELGWALVSGMHRSWLALLQAGCHLVADHVLLEPGWRADLAGLLHAERAYLIAVNCPLDVLEARELSRKDRTLGQARAQYACIHRPDLYDFAVDSDRLRPEEAARAVLEFLAEDPLPTALPQLYAARLLGRYPV